MNQHNQLLDALDTTIAWELPNEDLVDVLNDQARMLAGDDPSELPDPNQESLFV